MSFGRVGIKCDGAAEHFHGDVRPPRLVSDHSQEVRGREVLRLLGEDLLVKLLRLPQAPA